MICMTLYLYYAIIFFIDYVLKAVCINKTIWYSDQKKIRDDQHILVLRNRIDEHYIQVIYYRKGAYYPHAVLVTA